MQARLLFIGTWTHADDNGVVRGNPAYLRAQIFPYDDNLRSGELNRWLDTLVECRMLIPIMWQGERYYVIRTFRKHQRTDRRVVNELIPSDELAQLMAPDGDPTCTQRVPETKRRKRRKRKNQRKRSKRRKFFITTFCACARGYSGFFDLRLTEESERRKKLRQKRRNAALRSAQRQRMRGRIGHGGMAGRRDRMAGGYLHEPRTVDVQTARVSRCVHRGAEDAGRGLQTCPRRQEAF